MGKLTAKKVEALRTPGHYVDGDGLALVIGKRGGKAFRQMLTGFANGSASAAKTPRIDRIRPEHPQCRATTPKKSTH